MTKRFDTSTSQLAINCSEVKVKIRGRCLVFRVCVVRIIRNAPTVMCMRSVDETCMSMPAGCFLAHTMCRHSERLGHEQHDTEEQTGKFTDHVISIPIDHAVANSNVLEWRWQLRRAGSGTSGRSNWDLFPQNPDGLVCGCNFTYDVKAWVSANQWEVQK